MKRNLLSLLLLISLSTSLLAQTTVGERGKVFTKAEQDSILLAFLDFTPGKVYYENQTVVPAKLNYHYFSQEVLFLQNEEIMKLDNLSEVVLITIGKRAFIPIGKTLAEIIINEDDKNIGLIESKKINIQEFKAGAYGTGGSTAAISNVQGIQGSGGTREGGSGAGASAGTAGGGSGAGMSGADYSGSANQHTFGGNITMTQDTRYFLYKDMKPIIATKKNFYKCYPKSKAFIDEYIATYKPSFNDKADLIRFVNACNNNLSK